MKELNKRTLLFRVGILLLGLGLSVAFAQSKKEDKNKKEPQEQPQPAQKRPRYVQPQQPEKVEYEDDYDEAEYERFKKIYDEKDPVKRTDGLLDYIQNGKSLTLKTYAIGAFRQMYDEYLKAKNWQALVNTSEKFLKLTREKLQTLDKDSEKYNADRLKAWEEAKPNERGDKPRPLVIQGAQLYDLYETATAEAYYELGNKPKTAEWGERIFAKIQKPETAYILASTYRDLKNEPKFLEWAKKALEMNKDKPNIVTDLSVELFRYYIRQKNNNEALKYGHMFMKTLPNMAKPAAMTEAQWNTYKNGNLADAQWLEAEQLYNQKKYKEALPLYQQVLQYDKKRDAAMLRIGFIHWHMQDVDKAMDSFVCCEKLKGQNEAACRKELERIYKSIHNNTTIGIQNIYHRAKCP